MYFKYNQYKSIDTTQGHALDKSSYGMVYLSAVL